MKNTFAKGVVALSALAAIGAGAAVTTLVSAQTDTNGQASATAKFMHHRGPGMGKGHGVMGTVSSVNGNTVTLTGADGQTYTVDATSAKVSKVVDLSVADIKVGDTLGVMGTVSGNSVSAVHIMDGIPQKPNAPPTQTTTQ